MLDMQTQSVPAGQALATRSLRAMRNEGPRIAVEFDDGSAGRLSTRWLRLACECGICGDTASGKRWLTPADVPADIRAASIEISTSGTMDVVWQDGHVSRFAVGFLAAHARGGDFGAPRFQPELWNGDLGARLGRFAFDAVVEDEAALFQSLRALCDHGIAMLTGVPAEPEATLRVAGRYGPVRETSYGKVFDLISRPDARVAGETARAQIPHTDEPFRYSPPGFIFFHAIRTGAGSGGTSLMVDGFQVAERMRTNSPELFDLLARHGVTFHREHAGDVFFSAEAHVISLDASGAVTGIRFNDRCLAPQTGAVDEIDGLIEALAELTRLICDPANQFRHQLQPGEVLVFDNQRVLHGRTEFDPTLAVRHLRSCNLDRDGVHSAFRTLARRFAPEEAKAVLYQGAIF
ncbi:TauD/TfdA family dioxygenase [Mesorhizobium sp. ESP-6-4]|uniref:clavaminate synthase family protein n=1 Tax=Mesorhizobium sp. ESP-6-4 TaxID=2876624 RepID=UPI001CD01E53|nr:TauD/TfdA family dioxygenase [Mesorhizobium sp. ESP-6-4]MBZ9661280.1 TauD/TfdA family dioxygenase [Mesorhizobium sp. ESP-6-4]